MVVRGGGGSGVDIDNVISRQLIFVRSRSEVSGATRGAARRSYIVPGFKGRQGLIIH